jgi:hypothetical protein
MRSYLDGPDQSSINALRVFASGKLPVKFLLQWPRERRSKGGRDSYSRETGASRLYEPVPQLSGLLLSS